MRAYNMYRGLGRATHAGALQGLCLRTSQIP